MTLRPPGPDWHLVLTVRLCCSSNVSEFLILRLVEDCWLLLKLRTLIRPVCARCSALSVSRSRLRNSPAVSRQTLALSVSWVLIVCMTLFR